MNVDKQPHKAAGVPDALSGRIERMLVQPKYIQAVSLALSLFVGILALDDAPVLTMIQDQFPGLYEALRSVPFINGRIATHEEYRHAGDVIVLCWLLSGISMGYAVFYMAVAMLGNKRHKAGTQIELLTVLDKAIYSKMYLPIFRPSAWLIPQAKKSGDYSGIVQQLSSALSLPQTISLALRLPLLRQHTFILTILAVGIVWLGASDADGLLSRTEISFYFGYPLFIFFAGMLAAELAVYGLALALSGWRRSGEPT